SLIPNTLTQGMLGYAFSCPDMIGGGENANFTANSDKLDDELFVRYAQCAALMPMMQFSAAPWRELPPKAAELCVQAAKLHEQYTEDILALAKHAAQ
ncbi:glycoside hydrolase, partial [Ruthenibacterium lactatiformans]|nr:glycoside hydrolase [Ruthenibacterium lactatiformans]